MLRYGLMLFVLIGAQVEPKTTRWNFNDDAIGSLPSGFTAESGKWAVRRMSENRVALHQEAKSPDKVYNIALLKLIQVKNLELSVHIHALEGDDDLGVASSGVPGMPRTITWRDTTRSKTISGSTRSSTVSEPNSRPSTSCISASSSLSKSR